MSDETGTGGTSASLIAIIALVSAVLTTALGKGCDSYTENDRNKVEIEKAKIAADAQISAATALRPAPQANAAQRCINGGTVYLKGAPPVPAAAAEIWGKYNGEGDLFFLATTDPAGEFTINCLGSTLPMLLYVVAPDSAGARVATKEWISAKGGASKSNMNIYLARRTP